MVAGVCQAAAHEWLVFSNFLLFLVKASTATRLTFWYWFGIGVEPLPEGSGAFLVLGAVQARDVAL